jgi:hypothetical protein
MELSLKILIGVAFYAFLLIHQDPIRVYISSRKNISKYKEENKALHTTTFKYMGTTLLGADEEDEDDTRS